MQINNSTRRQNRLWGHLQEALSSGPNGSLPSFIVTLMNDEAPKGTQLEDLTDYLFRNRYTAVSKRVLMADLECSMCRLNELLRIAMRLGYVTKEKLDGNFCGYKSALNETEGLPC